MTGIIVAFPKPDVGKKIKSILSRNGFHVISICTNGAQVIQEANELGDGVVICPYRLPDMIYLELKNCLPERFQMITITSQDQWADNGGANVVSLTQPLKIHELLSTLEMVVYQVERIRKKRRSQPKHRSREEQELINQAKEILMNRNNMSESEAHRYLQRTSMNNGSSLTETAQMILSMMDL